MNNKIEPQGSHAESQQPTNVGTLENPAVLYKEQYGMPLSMINDPPKQVYVVGNTSLLGADMKYLCVIGSRKFTEYGKSVCESLIKSLKDLPVVIVSGLALGIDSIAHKAALDVGLPTIAVPGSGLHPSVLYPRSHFNLAKEILAKGGLLLSEYPPRTVASPWTFPVRNRIMAGLSNAVLIIEAEEDSGTLITAHLALDYNRDVLVVPGSVYASTSKGPHVLLRKGALSISNGDELRAALGFPVPESEQVKKNISSQSPLRHCSDEEKKIIKLLGEPRTREELVQQSGLPVSQVQILLAMLEIRKIIKEEYGKVHLIYIV